jgi:UDPglucose 6-dehydrogenase
MIKYASNAFLATKIAFSNEVANLCEKLGIDVYDVMRGVGYDARIGSLFLRAGAGFGGSCFPKDVSAIAALGKKEGAKSLILEAVLEQNDVQPGRVVAMLKQELGSLKGKRVALLGLAFKPDTDDVRETRALPIYKALKKAGAAVTVYDPQGNSHFAKLAGGRVISAANARDALKGKDGVIIQTEWDEFKRLSPADFKTLMKRPIVVDGRRTFDPVMFSGTGVVYRAVGLGKRIS